MVPAYSASSKKPREMSLGHYRHDFHFGSFVSWRNTPSPREKPVNFSSSHAFSNGDQAQKESVFSGD